MTPTRGKSRRSASQHAPTVGSLETVPFLYAEAKGRTADVGLDVDTMYGQILRRMPIGEDPNRRFAVVVPREACAAALRVSSRVRGLLRIEIYCVDEQGAVSLVAD